MTVQMTLRKTPLNQTHRDHGAKMVEFGGWDMPLQFSKVLEEHHAVRQAAGLFDISHMGLVAVTGETPQHALEALNFLVPQDLSKLYPGKAVYTQFLNESGGCIDDIIVYWMPETAHFHSFSQVLVICNAANTDKDMAWMTRHVPDSVSIAWSNDQFSLIALQGPQFEAVLRASGLTTDAVLPKRFHIAEYVLHGIPVLLSRTGYTGEDGVEIIVASERVAELWTKLLESGASLGIRPVGLAARDTLRLEAAYPLHGSELTESITPLEAGLGWSVKLDQPGDFIGKTALIHQRDQGLKRHFVCFEVIKQSIARHHDVLYDANGTPIGEVTSGSISPTLNKPVGVGYVATPVAPQPGDALWVGIRGNKVEAHVVERPFYRK